MEGKKFLIAAVTLMLTLWVGSGATVAIFCADDYQRLQ
jgi:hypothetical protein